MNNVFLDILITVKLKYLRFILRSGSDLVLRYNSVFQTTPLEVPYFRFGSCSHL